MPSLVQSLAAAAACATVVLASSAPLVAQHYIAGPDSLHPRIRYSDSLDSPNHSCMVSGAKLNPAMRPVYVNETPVGFC
jgi:hypothetical protein